MKAKFIYQPGIRYRVYATSHNPPREGILLAETQSAGVTLITKAVKQGALMMLKGKASGVSIVGSDGSWWGLS